MMLQRLLQGMLIVTSEEFALKGQFQLCGLTDQLLLSGNTSQIRNNSMCVRAQLCELSQVPTEDAQK